MLPRVDIRVIKKTLSGHISSGYHSPSKLKQSILATIFHSWCPMQRPGGKEITRAREKKPPNASCAKKQRVFWNGVKIGRITKLE